MIPLEHRVAIAVVLPMVCLLFAVFGVALLLASPVLSIAALLGWLPTRPAERDTDA